ncbi:MAG: DNA mismatch repair endonuclease MutL [Eubacteriales bacterium]|nr:DNA mismatch repair endonuclease MutL [Eubacteriales bacterium]
MPQEVVSLIAAGEVVERPAACVKELVENSLDAGATAVTVSITGGGLDMIRVTDNGSGIQPGDLRLAFAPHATSKLGRAEELMSVATLGFRGEALASISRVSRMSILSRRKGSDLGMLAENDGGEMGAIREAACAEGTQVQVKDLFFNAPVRKDFLRRPQRETALVAEIVQAMILARPDVAFRLMADGKQLYFSPGDGSLSGAVLAVFGVDVLKGLKEVDGGEQGLLIQGFVGVGEQARGNRAQQHFFLNGRAVRSRVLSQALEEACRHRVMIGRYPLCALHLTLPFNRVDVNVHPNKWEVRFADEGAVTTALMNAAADALKEAPLFSPPPLTPQAPMPPPASILRREPEARPPEASRALMARDSVAERKVSPPAPTAQPAPEQVAHEALKRSPLNVIGVAFNTYILALHGESLLLIDQHALHERMLFDRMMARVGEKQDVQTLLAPRVMQLDYPAYQTFLAFQDDLAQAGFLAEDFGDRSVRLTGVPLALGEPLAEASFLSALDELQGQGTLRGRERLEKVIMSACKHAVKGGERLPEGALQALADEMVFSGITPTCPHGRPIVLALSRGELERRFGRIQK